MSKYVSQRTLVSAQISADLAASLGVTAEQSDLLLRANELRAADDTTALNALLTVHGQALSAAARQLVPGGATDLATSINAAAARVREVVTSRLIDDALAASRSSDLGFSHVAWTIEPDIAAIRATTRDGHGVLDIRVDRKTGQLDREWQVGPTDACTVLDQKLVQELEQAGWILDTTEVDQHDGRRDGARLIKPADEAAPGQPTVGAVLDSRTKTPAKPSKKITDDSTRATRAAKRVVR
jgi:hypothetical protein